MSENKSATTSRFTLKTWVALGMLTAVAYVVMLLSKMLPSVNGFLDFDFKDVVICIGGFIYGPLAAAFISIVVALVEMFTVSHTGPIGLIMNILATCSFCCTATFIYKKRCGTSLRTFECATCTSVLKRLFSFSSVHKIIHSGFDF